MKYIAALCILLNFIKRFMNNNHTANKESQNLQKKKKKKLKMREERKAMHDNH